MTYLVRNSSIRIYSRIIGLIVSLGLAWTASAAELEEITVTAQKREQNVQDVPIAISTFTGASMEAKAITQVAQISDYAPNVHMDPTTPFGASNNILAAYIRGIGQSDFAFNLEPGVGIYVDGVYMARTIGANVDLLDVERLEVLKGPQGTLFGRNTIGGAINVITRRPGDEYKYRGEVTTGKFNRLDIRGSAEGPLIKDTLFGLVAFSSKNRDGYQKNVPFPGTLASGNNDDRSDQFLHAFYDTSDTNGGENQDNIRGKLLWDVNDRLDIQFTGQYSTTDEDATATSLLRYFDNPAPGASFTHLYDLCINVDVNIPPCFFPRGSAKGPAFGMPIGNAPVTSQPALGPGTFNPVNGDADPNNNRTTFASNFTGGIGEGSPFITGDPDISFANGPNFSKLEIWDGAVHLDYDLANDWHAKYIGSYRYLQFNAGLDFDSSPLAMLEVSFDTKQQQYSNEIQFSGLSWNDRWEWVAGFYQFHEEGDLTDFVTFPAGFLQIYGQNFFDTDAWAVFTHNNFAVTDKLSVTFGLRYTDEDRKFEGKQRDLNLVGVNGTLPANFGCAPLNAVGCSTGAFPDQTDLTRYYPLGVNEKSFTDVTIKAGIEYAVSDDMMTYVSYSEGFKGGGWSTRLSTPHLSVTPPAVSPFLNPTNELSLDFDEEEATSYEIGLKSEWLDRTLQLNMAFFFTEYDNIQVTKQVGPSPVFDTAGDGEIVGFEIDGQWLATDNLTFEGSLGWQDAEYTKIDAGVNITLLEDISPALGGVPTPLSTSHKWVNIPEWDVNLAGTYTHPMASGASLSFRADWSHTSEMANDLSNTPELMQPSVDYINLSATYTNPSDNWDISVGGRNVTDERHIITGQIQPAAGMVLGTYNRPAEWYLTLRFRN